MRYRRYLLVVLILVVTVQFSGCNCDCGWATGFPGRNLFFANRMIERSRHYPISLNCGSYSGKVSVSLDQVLAPESTLQQLAVPNPSILWISLNAGTQVAMLTSPTPAFNGLTGSAVNTSIGAHFDFSGNTTSAGFPAKTTLAFDISEPPDSQPVITNLIGSILVSIDKQATTFKNAGNGLVLIRADNSACNSPHLSFDPVNMSNGEFVLEAEDLLVPGPLSLPVQRHYGSLNKFNGFTGALGDNWMHTYETRLTVRSNSATVLLFGGGSMIFNKSGANWVLDEKQPFAYQLVQNGTNYQFLDAETNRIYTFSSTGALTRIEDRNGNALTITQSPQGPAQVSDGLNRTLTFTYNAAGNLVSVKDQGGRTVTYAYNGSNLAAVTDPEGKVTTYGYTAVASAARTGLINSIKRAAGNTVLTQNFDPDARVLRQVDGLNNATAFAYDNPAPGTGTMTDPLGNKTQAAHPDLRTGRQITDANNKATTIVYDAGNHPTQVTDRLGNRTTVGFDLTSGLRVSLADAAGAVTSASNVTQTQGPFTYFLPAKLTYPDGTSTAYTYDANGNLLTVTDQAGKVTTFTRNKAGQALTIKNPAGGITTNTYNSDGTLASTASPAGNTTQFGYDAMKRVIKITQADGSTETFAYNARSQVVQHGFGSGAGQTFTYDDNGNPRTVAGPVGVATTLSYDAADRAISIGTGGGTRSVVYDEVGRVKTLTNEAGERTSVTYDPVGRPLGIVDAAGNGDHFTWNAEGFPLSRTDAVSKTTTYISDALGRLLSATTPLGEKSTYSYDKLGRPAAITSALGHASKFTYGPAGDLVKIELPGAIAASFTTNDLGQVSAITDPNGGVWKLSTDNMGRLVSASDPLSQTTTVQYDSLDRVSSQTTPAGNVKLTYDAAGNPARMLFSDGTDLSYQFGPGGRLSGADHVALAYDAYGNITGSNGLTITRDALYRITGITYGAGMTVTYKYNSLGQLTEIDDWLGGATTFKYDAAYQIISMQRPNGAITAYTYDANGNLSGQTETTAGGNFSIALKRDAEENVVSSDRKLPELPSPGGGFIGYSYDAAHQLTGGTYDADGRALTDPWRSYTWNLASRLLSYSGSDGAAQFTYDGLGLRIASTTADGVRNYVWNYAHTIPAVAAVRAGDADLRYYIYLPDGSLLYSVEAADGSRHFYHFDEAGSTTFLTDDSGAVSDSYGITPFGESVSHTGATDNPFTFHGRYGVMQEGSTGLFYMRARYYDSATGRFLSRDPVLSVDPREINPYQFAMNNPLGFADPLGEQSRWNARQPSDSEIGFRIIFMFLCEIKRQIELKDGRPLFTIQGSRFTRISEFEGLSQWGRMSGVRRGMSGLGFGGAGGRIGTGPGGGLGSVLEGALGITGAARGAGTSIGGGLSGGRYEYLLPGSGSRSFYRPLERPSSLGLQRPFSQITPGIRF